MNDERLSSLENENDYRKKIYSQIQDEYGRLTYTYVTHNKDAGIDTVTASRFKTAQIILSAITTGGLIGIIVTNQQAVSIITAILSALLLIINAFLKGRNYDEEAKKHSDVANQLWPIREQYLSLLTDFDSLDIAEIRNKRDELLNRTAEIYAKTPPTSSKAYGKAQKALKEDEEQFFSQRELNKMLPDRLRK